MIPRKKCPNPDCMWIGTTNSYKCEYCKTTLVSAESRGAGDRVTVLRRRDKYGRIIYEHPDIEKIRVKGNGKKDGGRTYV